MKTFFIGLKNKLVIIKGNEDGYEAKESLHETNPTRIDIDPANKQRVYWATNGDDLWRSENSGKNWEEIGELSLSQTAPPDNGIFSSKMTAVAVHPTKQANENSVVYAGTEPSMLYYSENNGRTWREFKGI